MNFKKLRYFSAAIFVVFSSFLMTSCIDYVQSVWYKEGKYGVYCKFTLSKMLFELAEQDPESAFNDLYDEELSSLPENLEIKKVDTDLEVGAEIRMKIPPKTNDEKLKAIIPAISKNKVTIPFFAGTNIEENFVIPDEDGDTSSTEIAKAVLSSAKCRVIVAKNIVPEIETAYFQGKGGQDLSIPFFDYGNSWCFEIPLIALFDGGVYDFKNIVVIKK